MLTTQFPPKIRPVAAVPVLLLTLLSVVGAQGIPEQRQRLIGAVDLIRQNRYEPAADALDILVDQFGAPPYPADMAPEKRALMIETLEWRAWVRMSLRPKKVEEAKADLLQILFYLDPSYQLSKTASLNAELLQEFEIVRRRAIGRIAISVAPPDAIVTVAGRSLKHGAVVDLPVGPYTVSGARQGYRSQEKAVQVLAESDTVPVVLDLERLASSVFVVTEPPGVEVVVDKISRGTTVPDPKAPLDSKTSLPLEVPDLANGDHDVLLRRACYEDRLERLPINKPDDYRPTPFRMTPAFGSIEVTGGVPGAQVFYDSQPRGEFSKPEAPIVITPVCKGAHLVEVRTNHARDVARYTNVGAGAVERFQARLRPGVAIVSDSGASSNVVGGTNYYSSAEEDLRDATTIKLYAEEKLGTEFATANNLGIEWLHFDLQGQTVGKAASIGEEGRRRGVEQLAARLGAQGIAATATIPGSTDNTDSVLLLFATGSAFPDVIRWRIKDRVTNAAAINRLDNRPRHLRSSIGLTPIDVAEVGVVVGVVETGGRAQAAEIQEGSTILRAGNTQITSAAQFNGIVDSQAAGTLSLEIQPPNQPARRVDVVVVQTPRIVSLEDRSLLSNALTIGYRYLAVSAVEPIDQIAIRLNLAALLMRLRNHAEAEEELKRVAGRLKEVTGKQVDSAMSEVIDGTIQYLLAVCYEERRDYPGARALWQNLLNANGNLLTDNGEPLKDLATQRLKAGELIGR